MNLVQQRFPRSFSFVVVIFFSSPNVAFNGSDMLKDKAGQGRSRRC